MGEGSVSDIAFEAWVREVDKLVAGICGLTTMDGEDWLSRDTFLEGATPAEGAVMWAETQESMPEELLEAFYELA